ncbi:MAG: hypothetical protein ACK4UK_07510 [Flavobacterium sp.]
MKLYLILLGFVFISCQNKQEKEITLDVEDKKSFEMYEFSEMAMLMEQMYVENERLKSKIMNGDDLGEFPDYFVKIHEAVMTDPSENDAFFKEQAELFIKAQKQIYDDTENAEAHYNTMINQCINCHQVKCGGPIPKIKKLYLNSQNE